MKKVKSFCLIVLAMLCLAVSGCSLFELGLVKVNHWGFTPAQVSGTQIDTLIVQGSYLSFDFTVYNNAGERTLKSNDFDVVIVESQEQTSAEAVYFDDLQTSLNFAEKSYANIKLKALCTKTVTNSAQILIKYDGTTICRYLVAQA